MNSADGFDLMWPSFLSVGIGVWLMASPGVLGYGDPASSVSWIAGPLAASIAFLAAFPITRGLWWANVAVGAGVAVCALALDQPLDARMNALATGAALIVLAAATREAPDRYRGRLALAPTLNRATGSRALPRGPFALPGRVRARGSGPY